MCYNNREYKQQTIYTYKMFSIYIQAQLDIISEYLLISRDFISIENFIIK